MLGEAGNRHQSNGKQRAPGMDYDPNLPWRDIRGAGFNGHVGPLQFAPMGGDRWCASVVLEDRHLNNGGVCHGGMLLTLADVAMGAATYAAGGEHPCATIQLESHFIAAAKPCQRLVAVATQLRRTRELSFMQCEIWGGGRRVMRASGIWKYLSSRAPAAAGEGSAT
jgi:uncharacterized protein (TIGR00369 family)